MPFVEGETLSGWGVVRRAPWHFVGLFDNESDAKAKAAELGPTTWSDTVRTKREPTTSFGVEPRQTGMPKRPKARRALATKSKPSLWSARLRRRISQSPP